MINVFGSLGRVGAAADVVAKQGNVQYLTASVNKTLLQALSNRYAVGPLSSMYTASGGAGPAADPNADAWTWEASLDNVTGVKALDQIKGLGSRALVQLDSLLAALEGGTAPIRYIIAKDASTAAWYAQSGSNVAIIDVAAAGGAAEEKKGMSTAGKVVVGALILGGGWLAVKAISKPKASEAVTQRSPAF